MLPSRSKRFAGIDGRIERLHLITPWQLGLVVLLLFLLFALIFPRRSLLEELHRQERYDDLTLAYIDNLRRVDTGSDDLTVLMVRARLERIDYAAVEASLKPIVEGGDKRLGGLAARVLAAASLNEMRHLLDGFAGEAGRFERLRYHYETVRAGGDERALIDVLPLWIETLLRTPSHRLRELPGLHAQVRALIAEPAWKKFEVPERLALAALAMNAGMPPEAGHLLASIEADGLRTQLPQEAGRALGYGHYDTAAMLYLLARERAATRDEAREHFRQGIAALMAGGLYAQAMAAADRHLGDLAGDAVTLRYLTKTAVAAGDTRRAADYARRLVYMPAEGGRR